LSSLSMILARLQRQSRHLDHSGTRSHIFDHTLAQRTDSVSLAHGELHSE
jgi:hypothetical protein